MWDECNWVVVWAFFDIVFLWYWKENWPFPVLWPLLSFQNMLACWLKHFHSITFRIWNSLTVIPSPPLVLFIVMLPMAHLTSHSRMSGSRWVIMPLWLSESWQSFLYSSSVYSWHLFLISSASVRSLPFLSFIETTFAWNVPLVSLIVMKRSLFSPMLLFSSISFLRRLSYLSLLFFGTLHSDAYIFPFLLCFSLLFLSQWFVRPPQIAILHFFCLEVILIPVSCTMPQTYIYSSSDTLSDLAPSSISHFHCIIIRDLI